MEWHLDRETLRTIAANVVGENYWAWSERGDLIQIGALAAVEKTAKHDPAGAACLKTWQWKHAEWAMMEAMKVMTRRRRIAAMVRLDPQENDVVYVPSWWEENRSSIRAALEAIERLPACDGELLAEFCEEGVSAIAKRRGVSPSAVSHACAKVVERVRAGR